MTIGIAIAVRRQALGLTQAELGRRAGLKREYVCRIEHNGLPNLTLKTIRKLALALETKASALLAETE